MKPYKMRVIIGGISLITDDISLHFWLQGIGFKRLIYLPPWYYNRTRVGRRPKEQKEVKK